MAAEWLLSQTQFEWALSACGMNVSGGVFAGVSSHFPAGAPAATNNSASLANLTELALLMGNIGYETDGLTQFVEQGCSGTSSCTGGALYYGRGFLQLTHEDNYEAAAAALQRPDIVSNPDIVASDSDTDWDVTAWFWKARVQPVLMELGFTIGASASAINGDLECGSGHSIPQGRIDDIQCIMERFNVSVDQTTFCSRASPLS
ncbi:Chitinase 1, partial [Entophlyctis luteolus]